MAKKRSPPPFRTPNSHPNALRTVEGGVGWVIQSAWSAGLASVLSQSLGFSELGVLNRLGEGLETGLPVGADLSCPSVPNGFQRILPLSPLSSQLGNVSTDLRSGSASILEALWVPSLRREIVLG